MSGWSKHNRLWRNLPRRSSSQCFHAKDGCALGCKSAHCTNRVTVPNFRPLRASVVVRVALTIGQSDPQPPDYIKCGNSWPCNLGAGVWLLPRPGLESDILEYRSVTGITPTVRTMDYAMDMMEYLQITYLASFSLLLPASSIHVTCCASNRIGNPPSTTQSVNASVIVVQLNERQLIITVPFIPLSKSTEEKDGRAYHPRLIGSVVGTVGRSNRP
ncbi:hypothetical protein RRG08_010795 [Elysia crispata]|uniref:Uncharacterized protein n=1 Tax=Elysia crispata TaxID=231223 RepID=A0AAE1AM38_9GAST|nr:hypothetical protein RRG08_010795 [Elysia crispata]